MRLTEEILEVLAGANPDGNLLYLSGTQLDRKLYEQVDAALQTVGGKWSKGKKAHVFPGPAWDAVMALTAQEEVTTAAEHRQATQFFETPPAVVNDLISGATLQRRHVVLEPSAGRGAIAEAVAKLVDAIDCIEIDDEFAEDIRAAGYARKLTVRDFLTVQPEPVYDRVIMNPPFAKGADVNHVRHALRFVRPGGRLVAVMAAGVKDRRDKASAAFRGLVDEAHGWFTDNPAGAFEDSGTSVRTVIVIIPVAGQDVAVTATEPLRVTTDTTAGRLPLFSPATASPGVYIRWDAWTSRDRTFRFTGNCMGCGRKTWRHDDGNDDVRGTFGDHTGCPMDDEDLSAELGFEVPEGTTYPRCAICWNDYPMYRKALDAAVAAFRREHKPAAAPPVPVAAETAQEPTQLDLFSMTAA